MDTLHNSLEDYYMARCLTLAARATRRVSPNPRVGCVVLDAQGQKIAEGFHSEAGGPHAEVVALDRAGDRARGGTLFVNLEPCDHHGKTPPCTERIIEAGIERVVCGTLDPNPQVAGRGRDRLQNARISVRYGFLEAQCLALNEMFFQYIRTQKPFVTLKLAMTADGRIADRTPHGPSRFTSRSSLQYVQHLRHDHDAMLTTAETVIADNPRLTVRDIPLNGLPQPWRVILDRRGRLNPDAYQVFDAPDSEGERRVCVITARGRGDSPYGEALRARGIEILEVGDDGHGLDMREALAWLAERGLISVLTEAGGRLAGHLLARRLAQKLVLFYAPQVLGDPYAPCAFAASERLPALGEMPLTVTRTRRLEGDWVVEATPQAAVRGVNIVRSYGPVALSTASPALTLPIAESRADIPADAPAADAADSPPDADPDPDAAPSPEAAAAVASA